MKNLQKTNCLNCSSDNYQLYDTENGFNLVKCSNCGLLYVNLRPSGEEISKAYLSGIHHGNNDIDVTGAFDGKKIPRYLKILKDLYLPEELAGKSWLDIGCGHGEFLLALKKFSNNKISHKNYLSQINCNA